MSIVRLVFVTDGENDKIMTSNGDEVDVGGAGVVGMSRDVGGKHITVQAHYPTQKRE